MSRGGTGTITGRRIGTRPCSAEAPPGRNARQHFCPYIVDEALHLAIHLFHAFPHLQHDGNSGDVHAKIARQVQDELQPLQVFFGIEARIAFGARRLQQSFALIQPQRLRMDAIHLRHGGNHVGAFRFTLGSHSSLPLTLVRLQNSAAHCRIGYARSRRHANRENHCRDLRSAARSSFCQVKPSTPC